MSIEIPPAVLEAVYREARAAYPAECCGWLTATTVRPCRNAQAEGDHPTAAARGADTAYVMAGDDLLAFNRAFDGADPPRVIYHSHPNGRAYFSATDREVALSPWGDGPTYDVDQLVVGVDGDRIVEAVLFAWSADAADFVEIARYPGAEL
jgi:[CysO sulfur-carrier protein]-S-L-cysteine hydrolase